MDSQARHWLNSVKSILIFGSTNDEETISVPGHEYLNGEEAALMPLSSQSTLTAVKQQIDALLQSSQKSAKHDEKMMESLLKFRSELELESHLQDCTEVVQKLEHYIKVQLKIQHMCLAKSMHRLKGYKSVQDIPDLVFAVCDDVPQVLLGHSKIKMVVVNTVNEIKVDLLTHFHHLFEVHLIESQKAPHQYSQNIDMGILASKSGAKDGTSNNDESNRDSGHQQKQHALWATFLTQARDWLLAYTLVNLLPTVLTETKSMVLEKFKETLDEALTPIWGRFHYHLQLGRESGSTVQLVWTFAYCRSFVSMLCDLSAEMTTAGSLQKLCNVDYARAGQQQVLDKACRFVRAHVAQVMVSYEPVCEHKVLCLQLVEEVLELDDWFKRQAEAQTAIQRNNSQNDDNSSNKLLTGTEFHRNSTDTEIKRQQKEEAATASVVPRTEAITALAISPVLYDSKQFFHEWLVGEHNYFLQELKSKCADLKKTFRHAFNKHFSHKAIESQLWESSSEANSNATLGGVGGNGSMTSRNGLNCYASVYYAICSFFLAADRYQRLPVVAQRAFSDVVLEPLLCTGVGLLLYRIRSCAVLYQISLGTYKCHGPIRARQPHHSATTGTAGTAGTGTGTAATTTSSSSSSNDPTQTAVVREIDLVQSVPELVEFLACAQYFQTCLSGASPALRSVTARSANGAQFRAQQWQAVQNWVPKVLISDHEIQHGYGTTDLIDRVWKLSDLYVPVVGQSIGSSSSSSSSTGIMSGVNHSGTSSKKATPIVYRYRSVLQEELSAARAGTSRTISTCSSSANDSYLLGECIDVARALTITLCNVLRKQLVYSNS